MKIIDNKTLSDISAEAVVSPRRRKNRNYHDDLADPINRMLNGLEPGTYVCPHRHHNPGKREVFIILAGSVAIVMFDDYGEVVNIVILGRETGVHAVEISPGEWHTVISLEPGSVVYEVKDGPYSPLDDKDFASWAPREGHQGAAEYLNSLEILAKKAIP